MGGLSFQLPFTSACLGVSSLPLCGIPSLAGFYSKDFIPEVVSLSSINLVGFVLLLAGEILANPLHTYIHTFPMQDRE
jgi:NADH:ubiquinone oxidoreductase subunit 5 (subunit L)/multisubunit Na+/H+ antiporter MnhA subunit